LKIVPFVWVGEKHIDEATGNFYVDVADAEDWGRISLWFNSKGEFITEED
jgi:hypothetical protein